MKVKLLRKLIIDYPSASALEFSKEKLYVIGDDVNYILCLDAEWNLLKEIKLFDYDGKRIPKPEKPDLEAAMILNDILYVIGSGSRSPQRDVAFIVNLENDSVKKANTSSFYSLFRDRGLIAEMNIEGFSACRDKILFFNRGNTIHPNQLIITDRKILTKQLPDRFKVMPVKVGALQHVPLGISGASYDETNDILLLTASAEDTDNAYDDGRILGSVLCVIYNAYAKLDAPELVVDKYLELENENTSFKDQKIESVCITRIDDNKYKCVLAADNDEGNSILFEVELDV